MTKKQKKMLRRILVTAGLLLLLQLVPLGGLPRLGLYLAAYSLISYDILRKAALGIRNGRVMDENFLMAVASLGAFALALWQRSGAYREACAVMLFYQTGELFQSVAVGKSRKNIAALMDIRPDHANVERDGELCEVDPEEVAVGTVIVVRPGEKIPLDGTVAEGTSSLNTAALTGESLPREVKEGDAVISGSINLTGLLRVRTEREFCVSTVSKILELMEDASSRKAKSEEFISRFARVYTPAVCLSALALAVLPPVVRLLLGEPALWSVWVYRALTFLVISCPCALVISIPLTFFAGLGGAGKNGILIKGSNFMETLSKVRTVVFDKTGTLTRGEFSVVKVCPTGRSEAELLEIAALCESRSTHPLSRGLREACEGPVDQSRVTDVQELSGRGMMAVVDGHTVRAGNDRLMAAAGIVAPTPDEAGTVIHVAVDGGYAGYLLLADQPKPGAREAVELLRKSGVEKLLMLTGDREAAARSVSGALGLDGYRAELLPADKVKAVEELLRSASGRLAFAGDGINDAPVLCRADIGVAMGALGSDAAIEAADVVLMDDDPRKLATAIRLSRKCLRIVYENIGFAIGVKLLCLLLGALGIANMWLAIFADVGVMILAVLNAIRALRI